MPYITRTNQDIIYRSFNSSFITALLGSRRVGKSTLVGHYAKENPKRDWVFLNMDELAQRVRVEKGELKLLIEEKIKRQIGQAEKVWVVIDEAQKCPALFDQIKLIYDEYKDLFVIKFILTGSGFLTLHQLSAETLVGRIELHYIREFNLRETILLQQDIILPKTRLFQMINQDLDLIAIKKHIQELAPIRPEIEKSLSEQLIWGGLPEVIQKTTINEKRLYLSNYLQTYLEKDVRAIETITDLNLYLKLMDVIAAQTGSLREDSEIMKSLSCSRDTLKKYRGYLLATLVYKEVFPFIQSSLKRLVKSPKGYLLNNGLITYLTGLEDLNILEKTGVVGHRFENWFLKELQINLDRETKRSEIYFWRTSTNMEVDFVMEKKPEIYPFEVTYSKNPQAKKIRNLKEFLREKPNAKYGIYIYSGDYYYDHNNKILFLPAWAFG